MFYNRVTRAVCAMLTVASLSYADIVIPSGTKVACRLEQTLSSATAEIGQQVQLSVTENVKIDDVIAIPQGSTVVGTVVLASEKRTMGRSGKLDFSVDKVRSADGDFIPLRYTMQKKQGEGKGLSTGVMTAGAAVLFWPAAPFFLLRKGKDVTINRGMVIEVFTDSEHLVKNNKPAVLAQTVLAQAAPAPAMISAPAAGETATVTVTSDMPDAEVEINGGFVGNTPSTNKLTPGTHKITVKSGAHMWSRDLNVQPGAAVNVKATLRK
jgi:PEGA domain